MSVSTPRLVRMTTTSCPWCIASDSMEDWTEGFCRPHTAEYESTTEDELDRQDRELAADLL
jgi:hypothetical protein